MRYLFVRYPDWLAYEYWPVRHHTTKPFARHMLLTAWRARPTRHGGPRP